MDVPPLRRPDANPDFDLQIRAIFRAEVQRQRVLRGKLVLDEFDQRMQWRSVKEEFELLYGRPPMHGEVEQIVCTAFTEGRRIAGWKYDLASQCWRRADGTAVVDDDGSEWLYVDADLPGQI